MLDLLKCNIIKMMPCNGRLQMLRISLKILYCPPLVSAAHCWHWVYSLGLVSRFSTVRSGTVAWREWGLCLFVSWFLLGWLCYQFLWSQMIENSDAFPAIVRIAWKSHEVSCDCKSKVEFEHVSIWQAGPSSNGIYHPLKYCIRIFNNAYMVAAYWIITWRYYYKPSKETRIPWKSDIKAGTVVLHWYNGVNRSRQTSNKGWCVKVQTVIFVYINDFLFLIIEPDNSHGITRF